MFYPYSYSIGARFSRNANSSFQFFTYIFHTKRFLHVTHFLEQHYISLSIGCKPIRPIVCLFVSWEFNLSCRWCCDYFNLEAWPFHLRACLKWQKCFECSIAVCHAQLANCCCEIDSRWCAARLRIGIVSNWATDLNVLIRWIVGSFASARVRSGLSTVFNAQTSKSYCSIWQ